MRSFVPLVAISLLSLAAAQLDPNGQACEAAGSLIESCEAPLATDAADDNGTAYYNLLTSCICNHNFEGLLSSCYNYVATVDGGFDSGINYSSEFGAYCTGGGFDGLGGAAPTTAAAGGSSTAAAGGSTPAAAGNTQATAGTSPSPSTSPSAAAKPASGNSLSGSMGLVVATSGMFLISSLIYLL